MSEVAIWQPGEVATPAEIPHGQLDDWIMVADKVVRLAEVICRSPFVPDGLRGSVPATAAAILTGRELGIPPMTSLANIHVIHGKPGLSALVMRALVLKEGHEWEDVDVSNTRVVLRGRRKGSAAWTTASFSAADAATAKLQLGGYPQDKLYARASARLARRAFADVIAGMPYAAEELEEGIVPDEDGQAAAEQPAPEPKPRTAQRARRARPETASPAQAASPVAAPVPPPQGAGEALPPLPGEEEVPTNGAADTSATAPPNGGGSGESSAPDERDYDTPGTVTPQQLTKIWATLTGDYGFGHDEKDQARTVCAHIAGHDLASSKDLSHNEAKAVIDTLSHWKAQAEAKGEHPHDYLIAVMVAEEAARDGH